MSEVVRDVLAEVDRAMALTGARDAAAVTRDLVVPGEPVPGAAGA